MLAFFMSVCGIPQLGEGGKVPRRTEVLLPQQNVLKIMRVNGYLIDEYTLLTEGQLFPSLSSQIHLGS